MVERRSAFQQAATQIDRAIWCVQEHPVTCLVLGLPTVVAAAVLFVPALLVLRSFQFPWYLAYLVHVVGLPTAFFMALTFCPLPGAVFVHGLATGRLLTPTACVQATLARPARLGALAIGWLGRALVWAAFLGVPALVLWPRNCLAGHVALFEDERRPFWRSRKLLGDEGREVYYLLALYAGIVVVLGLLVYTPRLILEARQLDLPVIALLRGHLGVLEVLGLCLLLVAAATAWTLSLTFLYLEIRAVREGADLQSALARVRAAHALGASTARLP